jgi:hypothetical protein
MWWEGCCCLHSQQLQQKVLTGELYGWCLFFLVGSSDVFDFNEIFFEVSPPMSLLCAADWGLPLHNVMRSMRGGGAQQQQHGQS